MPYIFGVIIFLFGTAIGSFVAVVANRYNTGLSFFKSRSFCFSCNTELSKKDLFPVFSYLFLKGQCRYCGSKIPKETFITEILMGILAVLSFLKSRLSFENLSVLPSFYFFIILSIFAIILLISIYDLKHFIIPDSFLIVFFILSSLYLLSIFFALRAEIFPFFLQSLISPIILTLPFLLLFLVSKGKWLGFGDVKYIAVIGFFLGFVQGLSAVILAFWIGAAFSLLALSLKYLKSQIDLPKWCNNLTIKSEIPFGPFLSVGIIISFYFNADLFQIHSLLNSF